MFALPLASSGLQADIPHCLYCKMAKVISMDVATQARMRSILSGYQNISCPAPEPWLTGCYIYMQHERAAWGPQMLGSGHLG